MFSFTELHVKLSELLFYFKEINVDELSKYISTLEQIDKILISLDILIQENENLKT